MKNIFLFGISVLILTSCTSPSTYQNPEEVSYSIEGQFDQPKDVEEAVQIIENNLKYATNEDMEGYLSTIVNVGHEETEKELHSVFEDYDLEHTVLSAEVLEQEKDRMLIRTEQQTVMVDFVKDVKPYRSHIAEANYELVKEDGRWKIKETILTNTKFID